MQLLCVVAIEAFLRVINSYVRDGELLVSIVMLLVPVFFYIGLVFCGGTIAEVKYLSNRIAEYFNSTLSFDLQARTLGWLFPRTESIGWMETWGYFDLFHVDFLAVFAQLPTIASLAIFTVILVPVRIPSLSIHTGIVCTWELEKKWQFCLTLSLIFAGEEVNFDKELIVQGMHWINHFTAMRMLLQSVVSNVKVWEIYAQAV